MITLSAIILGSALVFIVSLVLATALENRMERYRNTVLSNDDHEMIEGNPR